MTLPSLNLVGDEDLETAIEDVFDLRFTEREYRSMINVGAIHDVIDALMPARAGACETSMTFYRLRRGLILMGLSGPFRPATQLPDEFLLRPKVCLHSLSRTSGLRLPRHDGGPLMMACLLIGAGAILSLAAGLVLKMAMLGWIAAGALMVSILCARLDRGRLPAGLSSLRDLAHQASPLNFGRLVNQGGRVSSEITWRVLRDIIADVAEVEAEQIGRETLIYIAKKAVA